MSRLTDYKDAVYTNPWGDYDAEEDAGGGTADDKPSRSDAKFLYAAGLATRAQLESWFGSSTTAIIVAEAANLSDSQKATVAALKSSAPAGEVQGDPTFANNVAGLGENIANTLTTILNQSVPQSEPAAGEFAATDANLVKQAKDGGISAAEAYASLRANGASAEQAVAYMAARGVYYEPPPENTGAPGNVGGASGGTGGASGGGSGGGGGTAAGGSAAPLSRRDQLKAALNAGMITEQDYNGLIQQLNREERDAFQQTLVDYAKDFAASQPGFVAEGTRVTNYTTGDSFDVTYSKQYGYDLQPSGQSRVLTRAQGIKTGAAENPLGPGTSFAGAKGTSSYNPEKAMLADTGLADEYWQAVTGRTPSTTELAAAFGSVDPITGKFHSGTVPDLQLNTGLMQDLNALQRYGLSPSPGAVPNLQAIQQMFKDAAEKSGRPYVDPFAGAFGPYKSTPSVDGAFKVMGEGARKVYQMAAEASVNGDVSGFEFGDSGVLTRVPGFDTSENLTGDELAAAAMEAFKQPGPGGGVGTNLYEGYIPTLSSYALRQMQSFSKGGDITVREPMIAVNLKGEPQFVIGDGLDKQGKPIPEDIAIDPHERPHGVSVKVPGAKNYAIGTGDPYNDVNRLDQQQQQAAAQAAIAEAQRAQDLQNQVDAALNTGGPSGSPPNSSASLPDDYTLEQRARAEAQRQAQLAALPAERQAALDAETARSGVLNLQGSQIGSERTDLAAETAARQGFLGTQQAQTQARVGERNALIGAEGDIQNILDVARGRRARGSTDYRYGLAGLNTPQELLRPLDGDVPENLPPGVRFALETNAEFMTRQQAQNEAQRGLELEQAKQALDSEILRLNTASAERGLTLQEAQNLANLKLLQLETEGRLRDLTVAEAGLRGGSGGGGSGAPSNYPSGGSSGGSPVATTPVVGGGSTAPDRYTSRR